MPLPTEGAIWVKAEREGEQVTFSKLQSVKHGGMGWEVGVHAEKGGWRGK